MYRSLFVVRSATIILLLLVALFAHVGPSMSPWMSASVLTADSDILTVTFLDVGQGDAIFIETSDGVQVLIDGGPDSGVVRELAKQLTFYDKDLDVVVATHSDKDHIGGLIDVLNRYEVETVVRTENKNDTEVAALFDEVVAAEGAEIFLAQAGQQLQLGASTTLLILSPEGDSSLWESNTASIVAQLQYGDSSFMLTGDAPVNIEEYVAKNYGLLIESDVLKLGHHGSRTSTSDIFLEAVAPKYAVVSAGKDNSYGHPHQEVIESLKERAIPIVETARAGNIVFKSDGKNIWMQE